MSFRRLRIISTQALAWGLLAGTALAVAPEIRDQGKFFSPEALKKADEQIREICRKYDRDLLIETFASPPTDQADKVKAMGPEARAEFFAKWAKDRARERVVQGVYVLIVREPRYLYTDVYGFGDRKRLPDAVAAKVREAFIAEFRRGRFDEGLQEAVRAFEQSLDRTPVKK